MKRRKITKPVGRPAGSIKKHPDEVDAVSPPFKISKRRRKEYRGLPYHIRNHISETARRIFYSKIDEALEFQKKQDFFDSEKFEQEYEQYQCEQQAALDEIFGSYHKETSEI